MRKLIVMLWVFFTPITSILAQSIEDRQEVYDQLKEWAVIKLTIAYMEDLYSFTPEEKGNNGNNKEYETYKQLHNDYSTFKEGIELDEISEILNAGQWSGANKVEFRQYKKELITLSEYSEFIKVKYTPDKTFKGEQIGTLNRAIALSEIKDTYDEFLGKINIEEVAVINEVKDDSDGNSKVEQIVSPTSIETKSNSIFSLMLKVFVGILLFVSLIINFKINSKNKKLKEKLKIKRKEIDNLNKTCSSINNSQENISDLRRQLEHYKSVNKTLQDALSNLENKQLDSNESLSIPSSDLISEEIELDLQKQNKSNIIYLSSPFQKLTFANEDASKDKTLNSLYFVEFNEQMQNGELSVLTDSDLSKALNSPDTYLETACIYDNEYSNNARAIKVLEKGEIKLEGEDWIVTKKVRIKFI